MFFPPPSAELYYHKLRDSRRPMRATAAGISRRGHGWTRSLHTHTDNTHPHIINTRWWSARTRQAPSRGAHSPAWPGTGSARCDSCQRVWIWWPAMTGSAPNFPSYHLPAPSGSSKRRRTTTFLVSLSLSISFHFVPAGSRLSAPKHAAHLAHDSFFAGVPPVTPTH